MTVHNRISFFAKAGAVAAVVLGSAFVPQAAAFADAPAVSVTPSANLPETATVSVAATGFSPNADYFVVQCVHVSADAVACNAGAVRQVTTDANGAVTAETVVNRTFDGILADGSSWGTVDCKVQSCAVGVGSTLSDGAEAVLSFA